ncbi:uncharacterized protein LOC135104727 [Scylla paramamosain]|uniref:uncharacterized protein LOC135104727 n=1 Tax=Scylla paramamosain TaxID=85552 RepID=UPI003083D7A1
MPPSLSGNPLAPGTRGLPESQSWRHLLTAASARRHRAITHPPTPTIPPRTPYTSICPAWGGEELIEVRVGIDAILLPCPARRHTSKPASKQARSTSRLLVISTVKKSQSEWKEILLVGFASVALRQAAADGGAESLSFHGFLPIEYIRSKQPRGDNQPNDVYLHLQPRPFLQNDEDVYYPPTLIGFGLEHGQDPEERVYKVYSKKEVEDLRSKQLSKHGKHDKGGKGDHGKAIRSKPLPPPPSPHSPQQPSLPHPPPLPLHHLHHHSSQERFPAPSSEHHSSYPNAPPPPPQYHPKPAFPPALPHRG